MTIDTTIDQTDRSCGRQGAYPLYSKGDRVYCHPIEAYDRVIARNGLKWESAAFLVKGGYESDGRIVYALQINDDESFSAEQNQIKEIACQSTPQ